MIKINMSASPSIISRGSSPSHEREIYEALYENLNVQDKVEEIRDVFISHVSDDKESFVQPLADEMTRHRISKWYDKEQSVNMWERSLREELDNGIKLSRFSLVVFSKNYFRKYWTKRELDSILRLKNVHFSTMALRI